jgi:hypothetical protein
VGGCAWLLQQKKHEELGLMFRLFRREGMAVAAAAATEAATEAAAEEEGEEVRVLSYCGLVCGCGGFLLFFSFVCPV